MGATHCDGKSWQVGEGVLKFSLVGESTRENREKQLNRALFQFTCLNPFQADDSIKAKKY